MYMAPELLKNSEFNEKIDVYSFAIILWEILTFQPLFPEYGDSQGNLFLKHMTESNLRPQLPTNCPAPLSRLITSCWDENPANRPSFSQVSTFPSSFPSLLFPSLPFPSLSLSFPSFHQDLSPTPQWISLSSASFPFFALLSFNPRWARLLFFWAKRLHFYFISSKRKKLTERGEMKKTDSDRVERNGIGRGNSGPTWKRIL